MVEIEIYIITYSILINLCRVDDGEEVIPVNPERSIIVKNVALTLFETI